MRYLMRRSRRPSTTGGQKNLTISGSQRLSWNVRLSGDGIALMVKRRSKDASESAKHGAAHHRRRSWGRSKVLNFDPASHTFTWEGVPVPNVTRILSPLYGLEDPVYQSYLESGRQRGTAVHEATERHDRHLAQAVSGKHFDPMVETVAPYLAAWAKFLDETRFMIDAIEEPVYHPRYRYAGILDRLGVLNGRRVVIDIKTSASIKPVMGIQLAAYQAAVNEDKPKAEQYPYRFICQLRKDGTYRLEEFRDRADFTVFLALLTIHQWTARYKK